MQEILSTSSSLLTLTLFILLTVQKQNKDVSVSIFQGILGLHLLWIIIIFLQQEFIFQPIILGWLYILDFSLASLFVSLFVIFSFTYKRSFKNISANYYFIFIITILTQILLFSGLLFDPYDSGINQAIQPTPLFVLYTLYYLICIIIGITYLINTYKKTTDLLSKKQIMYVGLGLLLSFAFGILFTLILPNIIKNNTIINTLSEYGKHSSLFLVTFTTYAIFKFQLFEIKLILAQIIVGTMSLILFGYVILSDNLYQLLVNGTIFMAFSATGWLLTHQIRRSMEQVEEIENANDELQEIIESKDIFLRMTSHQLRTPLTSLRGFIGIILDSWNTPRYAMNDNARHDLMLVHLNTHRLNSVVNDMLAINAIHSGRFGVSPREGFNLKEEFEYLVEDKKYLLEYYHTQIELHSHGPGDFIIEVDHMRIKDVFHNVIDNAIYYGEGKIWIDIYDHNDDWVEIDICDNGKGLTEEQRVEIWGQDYRYDPELHNANGTGMGLFITYHIIILHGGNIWAESAGPGQGSTFIMQLPKQTS